MAATLAVSGHPARSLTGKEGLMRMAPWLAILTVLVMSGACRARQTDDKVAATRIQGGDPMSLTVSSPSFPQRGEIPDTYTCQGADRAPALNWTGIPAETKSMAVIVDDPDAPGGTWTHWVLYDLPPATNGLPEGTTAATLPPGTREGKNDWHRTGYGGPCPPSGRHRYFYKVFALDTVLPDLREPTRQALEKAMAGHVLARAELVGTYQKH